MPKNQNGYFYITLICSAHHRKQIPTEQKIRDSFQNLVLNPKTSVSGKELITEVERIAKLKKVDQVVLSALPLVTTYYLMQLDFVFMKFDMSIVEPCDITCVSADINDKSQNAYTRQFELRKKVVHSIEVRRSGIETHIDMNIT